MGSDAGTGNHKSMSGGRCLKTGTETLRALQLVGAAVGGITPDELAAELTKSRATARYLLNTLCQQGFVCRDPSSGSYLLAPVPPWGRYWGQPAGHDLEHSHLGEALSELHGRTRQRTYLARIQNDAVVLVDARGHQGLPRIPGLTETISTQQAHALAASKSLAALSHDYGIAVRRSTAFDRFTHTTITDPTVFEWELARVRRNGFAVDREEFAEGICCIAAPILDPSGEVAASLAISVPTRRFDGDRKNLIDHVVRTAAAASDEWRESVRQQSRAAPATSHDERTA